MPQAADFLARLETVRSSLTIDWEGRLEAAYLALLSGRDGLGLIDIGGHAGRHSLVMQQHLNPSHLMIFEPLPLQRQALEAMFSHHPGVKVLGIALGNRRGETTFVVKQGSPEESGLIQRIFFNDGNNENVEHISIKVERLDDLNIDFRVDFIKMDTEGGEIDIIKGAKSLILRDAPVISVEYGPGGYDTYGYGPETLFEVASEIDYSPCDLFGNVFVCFEEWKSCVARFYWDFLILPNAKIPELAPRLRKIQADSEEFFFK